MNPESLLGRNTNGTNIILLCLEDWIHYQENIPIEEKKLSLKRNIEELKKALIEFNNRNKSPLIIALCPSSPKLLNDALWNEFIGEMEEQITTTVNSLDGTQVVINWNELRQYYELDDYYNEYGSQHGHVPYTQDFYTALGSHVSRKIYSIIRAPYKVILLDCDNTIWSGVVGESGATGVIIDEGRAFLQRFMIDQAEKGMLLCLLSKNIESDVYKVFDENMNMILKKKHFTVNRINWNRKSDNIIELAEELNLGLDSFIVIDDNPVECAEIRARCPSVMTLQCPANTSEIKSFISNSWAFDHIKVTDADRKRTKQYQENFARKSYQKNMLSLNDFITGLQLKIEIRSPEQSQIPRASQLTQRVNQFNSTTIRRTENDIMELIKNSKTGLRIVAVSDRFGDYGDVGLVVYRLENSILWLEGLILSCRSLGRGIEHKMINEIGSIAIENNIEIIKINYTPSIKNQPLLNFLESISNTKKEQYGENGFSYILSSKDAKFLKYEPVKEKNLELSTKKKKAGSIIARNPVELKGLSDIAENLGTLEKISQRITSSGRKNRSDNLPEYISPCTNTEKLLINGFEKVINVSPIGRTDDFFELGGSSLQAVELITFVHDEFNIDLTIIDVFNNPVLNNLADVIEKNKSKSKVDKPSQKLVIADRTRPMSLSSFQESLWFLDQFEDSATSLYNEEIAIRIEGELVLSYLENAIEILIKRHESLRMIFRSDNGKPYISIIPPYKITLKVIDSTPEDLEKNLADFTLLPFDLTCGPLFRAILYKTGPRQQVLLINLPHIISDGWSMGIIVNELSHLYSNFLNNSNAILPELEFQYVDYALYQKESMHGHDYEELCDYWTKTLADFKELDLPTKVRPAVQKHKGKKIDFNFKPNLISKLEKIATDQKVTMFMVLMSAFKLLLKRYSNQEDIVIGTPVANRNFKSSENLIGFFVNTVVVNTNLSGHPSFIELLQKVKKSCLNAYEHQELPFERLVDLLKIERETGRSPIFQVMFVMQNKLPEIKFPGMECSTVNFDTGISRFDLVFNIEQMKTGLSCNIVYNTELFSEKTIYNMAGHYNLLLENLSNDPSQNTSMVSFLSKLEKENLLLNWNKLAKHISEGKTIYSAFQDQVLSTPDHIAAVFMDKKITYCELDKRSNQLGNYLKAKAEEMHGINDLRGHFIGLCLERGLQMLIGLLGILKSGGVYVPIDPHYPDERIKFILDDTDTKMIVTENRIIDSKNVLLNSKANIFSVDSESDHIDSMSDKAPDTSNGPNDLAYIIYTSGSTGKPKGVMLQNKGAVNLSMSCKEELKIDESSIVIQYASINFDASLWSIFSTLVSGGTLQIIEEEKRTSPDEVHEFMEKNKISVATLPPALLKHFPKTQLPSLKTIVVAGETSDKETMDFWSKERMMINAYGPTETTVCASLCVYDENKSVTQIGKPLSNTRLYVLDTNKQLLPVGIPGELYVAGIGIAQGYLNRPELTAKSFIENPFINPDDNDAEFYSILYKTGDLVKRLENGDIDYIGRTDFQIKIRGFRVELGEIESGICSMKNIHQSIVLAHGTGAEKQLIAYYTLKESDGEKYDPEAIRNYLSSQIPDYMVPGIIIHLDQMPINRNGKIDRKALPQPDKEIIRGEVKFRPPENKIQTGLAEIWTEVLKLETPGIDDNFFRVGGNSLTATMVSSRINRHFNVNMPVRLIFENPTIFQISLKIEGLEKEVIEVIPVIQRTQHLPLSSAQKRLWFLEQIHTGEKSIYNIPITYQLDRDPEINNLESAVNTLIQRHESLRTIFKSRDGIPYQEIKSSLNLKISTEKAHPDALQDILKTEACTRFDLETGPLQRIKLLDIGENQKILVITMHHIISDGWSIGIMIKELNTLYKHYASGNTLDLKQLSIQYADYSSWKDKQLNEKDTSYWLERLDGFEDLELPTDFRRQSNQPNSGAHFRFKLDKVLLKKITTIASRNNTTLFTLLFSAFNILLKRYSGQDDIICGTPVANRNLKETEDIIGFFVNTLALRNNLSGNLNFMDLLETINKNCILDFEHQDIDFEQVVDGLNIDRSTGRSPVFQVMFILQNKNDRINIDFPGVSSKLIHFETTISKFDLTLDLQEGIDEIIGEFEYDTRLFKKETIERLSSHYLTLLESIVQTPEAKIDDLSMMTPEEQNYVLNSWNRSDKSFPDDKTIYKRFEEQVLLTPENIAVTFKDTAITYAELNQKANRLANHIRKKASEECGYNDLKGRFIGLCVNRGIHMITGMLAILKAGGVYVPLDPHYPEERLKYILEDTDALFVMSESNILDNKPVLTGKDVSIINLDKEESEINSQELQPPETTNNQNDLAYIIYTSGSTGLPKGVMLKHIGAANLSQAVIKSLEIDQNSRVIQYASINFDASLWSIFSTLLCGASLHIIEEEKRTSSEAVFDFIKENAISIATLPPALLTHFPKLPLPDLKTLVVAGESCGKELMDFWCQGRRFINAYGPTESTVCASLCVYDPSKLATQIGKPIQNTKLYVLDKNLNPLPIGLPGELYISGVGIAKGYLNRDDLTRDHFIENPFLSTEDNKNKYTTLYKTGDLVNRLPDGDINFIGRTDFQVKIRGFRVELGEIETLLEKQKMIHQTLVIAHGEASRKQLIAYFTVDDSCNPVMEIDLNSLKDILSEQLPDYMIPTVFIQLDKMPLNRNGKIDRKSLPEPSESELRGNIEFVPPETQLQKQLAEIWKEVLDIEKIGINDNFFQLGGNSLTATQVTAKFSQKMDMVITLNTLFEKPTIAELSLLLEETDNNDNAEPEIEVFEF